MQGWKVLGWNGTEMIYEGEFQSGSYTEKKMVTFLQRLACRHLTPDEIASASRKRRKGEDYGLLEPSRDTSNERLTLSVGVGPHYTATIVFPKINK